MEIMTTKHPRWDEFCNRLEGSEGCNFTEESWTCYGGYDKRFATAILGTMEGVDIEKSLAYFEENGGHCDCEILFNIDVRS